MLIRQKRSRELDDQDKSRRLVSSPLDRGRFCARKRVLRDHLDHWTKKFRRDRGPTLLQLTCRLARRSPQTLSAEAGAEYFLLCRSRMPQFESGRAAELV